MSGTNIVNKDGKKVQLKGVSTHGIAWFPQYVNKSCFQSFKKMGVNTIRLALYSDKGAGYSKSLYQKVDEGIRYATELGMYVVLRKMSFSFLPGMQKNMVSKIIYYTRYVMSQTEM